MCHPAKVPLNSPHELSPADHSLFKGTFLFDQIYFENIKSSGGGTPRQRRRRRKVLLDSDQADVAFDCDTGYNGKNNCDVVMKDVTFVDREGASMQCVGVRGTSNDVSGIKSCLKNA